MPTGLMGRLLEVEIGVSVELLQKVALFGTARILRKVLEVDLSCYWLWLYSFHVSLPLQHGTIIDSLAVEAWHKKTSNYNNNEDDDDNNNIIIITINTLQCLKSQHEQYCIQIY